MDDNDMLRTSAAAYYLDLMPQTIYSAIRNGKIESKKIDGMRLFSKSSLDAYMEQRWIDTAYKRSLGKDDISVKEAASILKTSEQKIYNLLKQKKLKFRKSGQKNHHFILVRKEIEDLAKT